MRYVKAVRSVYPLISWWVNPSDLASVCKNECTNAIYSTIANVEPLIGISGTTGVSVWLTAAVTTTVVTLIPLRV